MSEYIEIDPKEDHGHHHKETFITKYIFSQDHKMIAKQYLITGVLFMGVIGILMSLLMRLQIAWPEEPNIIFEFFLVVQAIRLVVVVVDNIKLNIFLCSNCAQ